jgi:hypothetical protein
VAELGCLGSAQNTQLAACISTERAQTRASLHWSGDVREGGDARRRDSPFIDGAASRRRPRMKDEAVFATGLFRERSGVDEGAARGRVAWDAVARGSQALDPVVVTAVRLRVAQLGHDDCAQVTQGSALAVGGAAALALSHPKGACDQAHRDDAEEEDPDCPARSARHAVRGECRRRRVGRCPRCRTQACTAAMTERIARKRASATARARRQAQQRRTRALSGLRPFGPG